MTANLQLDEHGKLRHLLTLDGLDRTRLNGILDTAETFSDIGQG